MKSLASLLVFGLLAAANLAQAVSLGAYKAVDAYCSNPDYVFSKEEQDYIDTLKGIGSCGDGKITSPPCFEDYYVFSTATSGSLVSVAKNMPGVECVTTTQMTYSENPPGTLDILLGKSTSQGKSNNPNVSISCENTGDGGDKISYQYKEEGGFLLLINPDSDAECGNFIFKAAPVKEVPR